MNAASARPASAPTVAWADFAGRSCLQFTFEGHLTLEGARCGIADWRARLDERPAGPVDLVWSCTAMEGYDPRARKAWQEALSELKPRTGVIWVVSTQPVNRIGARVMNLFVDLDVRAVASESEIAF